MRTTLGDPLTPNIRLVPMALCGKFGGGGGGAPPDPPTFAPDDVAGLFQWNETIFGVLTDGDGVYQWTDQSTSENHITQSTGSKKPDVVADHFGVGVDGIQGDALDDWMETLATITIAGDFSLFFIAQMEDADKHLMANDNAGFRTQPDEGLKYRISGEGWPDLTTAAAWVTGTDVLVEIHRDASNNLTALVDGVDKTSGTPTSASNLNLLNLLSRSRFSTYNLNVHGAIIMYDNKISAEDTTSMRTYLTDGYLS